MVGEKWVQNNCGQRMNSLSLSFFFCCSNIVIITTTAAKEGGKRKAGNNQNAVGGEELKFRSSCHFIGPERAFSHGSPDRPPTYTLPCGKERREERMWFIFLTVVFITPSHSSPSFFFSPSFIFQVCIREILRK